MEVRHAWSNLLLPFDISIHVGLLHTQNPLLQFISLFDNFCEILLLTLLSIFLPSRRMLYFISIHMLHVVNIPRRESDSMSLFF